MNQIITTKPSPELIAQINALHTECVDSAMTAIAKAMDAGDKLAQAKEMVDWG